MRLVTKEYAIVFDGDENNIVLSDSVEAYVKKFYRDILDDQRAQLVSFDRGEMKVVYSYEPSDCLACSDADEDNGEDICTAHQETVELDYRSVDVWSEVVLS